MPQIASYKFLRGLDLNSNPLYGTIGRDVYGGGRSACQVADDVVLTRQHMVGNRRGFDYFTASTSALVDWMYEYQSNIVQHQADYTLWHGDSSSGTRTQYSGTYTPPSGFRTDGAVGRGSLFLTSTGGVFKLDAVSDSGPILAGMTKGLDTRVATTGTGNGFMSGYSKAAYHVTWTRTDKNNQTLRSDVSSSTIVTNNTRVSVTSLTSSAGTATCTTASAHGFSSGDTILIAGATQTQYDGSVVITVTSSTSFTYAVSGSPTSPATGTITAEKQMNVVVTFTVPWDVQSGDEWEVWRTVTVDASGDPGDTCYLISRTTNTTAAGATVSFTDTTPDTTASASEALYTNATQETALQGNARPPVCSSMCNYKDYQIYANTAIDHQLTLEMLATINFTAGVSSLTIHRSDTLGNRTYTFNSSENVSTQTAQLYTGGLSNASNIELTARSLCHVINGDSAGYWYAEYTSGYTDNPGIMRIWARSPLTGSFFITASDTTTGNQFSPAVPTSGNSVLSSNDARQNRVFYSKYAEPDHCPIVNFIDVGRLDSPILRVLSIRDACFVIKTDGVWYLSGLSAPFSLVELDTTCHCVAAATAVMLNNNVYMLSNQGVVKVSLSGVTVISFDIEPAIMGTTLSLSNLSTVAFGVANESERQYMLWLPTGSGDTYATQAYVFHTFIEEWVRWTKPANAGAALNSNYALYISSGLENAVLKQRKNGDQTDYSDEELAITITGQTGTTVTATWSNTKFTPTAGVSLHQSGTVSKVLTATFVSGTTWTFTIDRSATYTNGAATARMPIYAHVRLSPHNCGESGILKSIYTVAFFLDSNTATQAAIEVASNEAPTLNSFAVTRTISGGWGTDAWGAVGWGDVNNPAQAVPWLIDLPIPDNTGEFVTSGWYHNVSQEQFVIAQVAYAFDPLTELEEAP